MLSIKGDAFPRFKNLKVHVPPPVFDVPAFHSLERRNDSSAGDFNLFIKRAPLKDLQQFLFSSIQVLVFLTRFECSHESFRHAGKCIKELAYEGIEVLCSESHGDVTKITRCLMNYCMPNVMMLQDDKPVQAVTIPRHFQNLKNDAVNFICNLGRQGNPIIAQSIRVLLQNMCIKIPDKAEYRNILSADICKIILCLPGSMRDIIMDWLKKYSRNAKIGYRVFSLDIMSSFLNLADEDQNSQGQQLPCKNTLLQAVFIRCSDRSPTVRAKALACLNQVSSSPCESMMAIFKDLLSSSINPSGLFQTQNLSREGHSDSRGSEKNTIFDLIRRRIKDERVVVRKAAVQAFKSVLVLTDISVANDDLNLLYERCMDPALSVRKQAVQCLTQLLEHFPANTQVQKLWLSGVLPMALDREVTAQEKCIWLLDDLILSKIVPHNRSDDVEHILAWNLLKTIAGSEGQESSQYFTVVCENWGKNGKINANLVKSLQTHLPTRNSKAAWLFISAISSCCDKFDPTIITDYWFKNVDGNTCSDIITMSRILKTIITISKKLSSNLAKKLLDDIQERIFKFHCPPELISLCVQCLPKLSTHIPDGEAKLQDWCERLLSICEEDISQSVLATEHAIPIDKAEVIKRLVTLGDIAQLSPAKTSQRMFLMVQSMLLPQPASKEKGTMDENENSIRNLIISSTVKAYAFGTLGKLCLQNDGLAKKCVAALARELETSDDPAVKNNVIVALCDLCVRYTNLVDRYIPNIAGCLADPEPIVRRQALTLLTHLLQEDFVKWKGSLFFRFITALVDENTEIKNFAEFCLVHVLLPRHPTMFSVHFVEALFCFNSYTKHRAYNQFQQTETERKRFSLAGESKSSKRMQIYSFLLRNMNDEQRFKLTGKICNEIFGEIVDDTLEIDSFSKPVIEDAFAIISCQDIKISSSKAKSSAEPEDGLDEEQHEIATQLRAKVISQIVKKNMIENIFPTIISLKKRFEQEKSSLLRDLMQSLKELMSDYKTEIKDILALDKQLATEIEYDLKKYEERQREAALMEAQPMTPTRDANISQHRPSASTSRHSQRTPLTAMQNDHPMTTTRVNAAITPRNGAEFMSPRLKTPTQEDGPVRPKRLPQTVPGNMKTPKRMAQENLATTALLNSAKIAMERMRRLSTAERTPAPLNLAPPDEAPELQPVPDEEEASVLNKTATPKTASLTPKNTTPNNFIQKDVTPKNATPKNVTPKDTTPKNITPRIPTPKLPIDINKRTNDFRSPVKAVYPEASENLEGRAISTPEGHLSHISFMALADLSLIPRMQSPVPVKIQRRSRRKGNLVERGKTDDRVICMPSPNKPSAKPNQWNVQSPARWNGPKTARSAADQLTRKNK